MKHPAPLTITNARENNLKEVSLEIPHDTLTVVTGLSGSGKSSLAFGTVYAEGQRRYIETFSPYTRQFFDKVKRPDVDSVEHVRPAIAIQQRTRVTNSRSTVGSLTNINDYLKILWSRLARPVCPACQVALQSWSAGELAAHIAKIMPVRGRASFLLCARISMPTKGARLKQECERLLTLGYSRWFKLDTRSIIKLDQEIPSTTKGNLCVVLDRFKCEAIDAARLSESIDQAFSLCQSFAGEAACLLIEQGDTSYPREWLRVHRNPDQTNSAPPFDALYFSAQPSCACGPIDIPKARPALFTFNHPLGACPDCKGFGRVLEVDPLLCVPDPNLGLEDKALQCWAGPGAKSELKRLLAFCKEQGIATDVAWRALPQEQRDLVFNAKTRAYRGVRAWFKAVERKAYKMHVRVFLSKYRSQFICHSCNGTRLKSGALSYRVEGRTIADAWMMTIADLAAWIEKLQNQEQTRGRLAREIDEVFSAIRSRLTYLMDLGLSYLTLDRQARTLSGGETQRVNLATAIGSDLISTHFVLDEPSVGLHARDTARLFQAVTRLTERGNSTLVVEHDLDFIRGAQHIIEMGPQAGNLGGQVVYNGPRNDWPGFAVLSPESAKKKLSKSGALKIRRASARNLRGFDVDVPLGKLICITGVSGSGKSTLVSEVLLRAHREQRLGIASGDQNQVEGFEQLEQVLMVDQSPLAKSPRANIATYTGIWDKLRDLLAATDDAQNRALSKSSFSFNVDGGRCPACKGAGFVTEDMQFLSDVYIPCEVCAGKRFQPVVLDVRCRGINVHELLNLSVAACAEKFSDIPDIAGSAATLTQLGLGHLTLGHPLSALSGGEAQRLKLVPFVTQSAQGKSLLIFDEPTTGLHIRDIERLLSLLQLLVERGHTVICVEHNLHLILGADWLIELGPEGGQFGGELVLSGTPKDFLTPKAAKVSQTAQYLQNYAHDLKLGHLTRPAPIINRRRSTSTMTSSELVICGAKEHNLKNIDLSIPLRSFVAFTGVSGSGKSSIAKDIIYAEGQRRYLDCLSPYARQFIKELKRPEVDSLTNIQPTICVYQHTFQPGRLSTVGTMCEAYNFLRLLYAKLGTQFCPDHPQSAIAPLSPGEIASQIKDFKSQTVRIMAPIIKMKKGNHRAILERARSSEIVEVRIDGVFLKPSTLAGTSGGLERNKAHTIEFVVAKFNPAQIDLGLINEAVAQALALGAGTLIVNSSAGEKVFSLDRTCPECQRGFYKPDPEELSFHSSRGACGSCSGTGLADDGSNCPACQGTRLNPVGRNIRIEGKDIAQASSLSASVLRDFLRNLKLNARATRIADPIIRELAAKLSTLVAIGLDYLALNRDCATLSTGELQRLRLATAMGSPLTGVMYIFDEPSVGLHPIDNRQVLAQLRALQARGNSVLMIEHDGESIFTADHIVEVGPGGGSNGGNIVFNGSRENYARQPSARGLDKSALRLRTKPAGEASGALSIECGHKNNIKDLSLTIPLGQLVVVAGVSGAGKSSLVHGIIADTLSFAPESTDKWDFGKNVLKSSIPIEHLTLVDQKPIGINSRSTPASYLGIWDEIRALFASSIEAKARGWNAGHFSYNTGKGRCPTCKGQGLIRLEMSFLADAALVCEECNGSRYSDETLSVRYLDLTI
ncbi:MAG: excinuclease ABC subunit UvrA, partial [Oligoflexia bacterium]|nr:excinuclease ABC subunit UvrA [Oligoflexia bacterium]